MRPKEAVFFRGSTKPGRAEKGWKIYETLPRSKEGEVLWSNLKSAWETWKKGIMRLSILKEGKRAEAVALSAGRERESSDKAERLLWICRTLT